LLWSLLASIVLHALVLVALSQREAPAPPAKALLVLTARLAPVASAPRVLPPAPSPKPVVQPPPPPKSALKSRPTQTAPASKPTPAAPSAASTESVKPAPAEAASAASASAASSAPSAGPSQAAPQPSAAVTTESSARAGSEADTGTLEQYRLALIVATRRYKRYPAIAMEKGWAGRVVVHLAIGANGMLASASIKTSSGHEILDNQALDMLKKGKTTVQVPPSLRGRAFSVDVPVIFNLDNPGA